MLNTVAIIEIGSGYNAGYVYISSTDTENKTWIQFLRGGGVSYGPWAHVISIGF